MTDDDNEADTEDFSIGTVTAEPLSGVKEQEYKPDTLQQFTHTDNTDSNVPKIKVSINGILFFIVYYTYN